MDKDQIKKVITAIVEHDDFSTLRLENFDVSMIDNIASWIINVINGVPEWISEMNSPFVYVVTGIYDSRIIAETTVRDILWTVGVRGEIAAFAACIAEEINKKGS